MITNEEKELRLKRTDKLNELIKMYNIKTSVLAKVTGLSETYISQMKSGSVAITLDKFEKLVDGINFIAKEYSDKPDVETENYAYVKQQLALHDNVFVNKKKVKDIENYLVDLKLNGFDCSCREVNDGYIISHNRVIKPMVEITKPKPVIEQDLSIIDKVRNMHQDSLVMHEQALELQASTEDIVKSVDEMEAKLDDTKPEFSRGSSVTSAFGLSVEPVGEVIITNEDIKVGTLSNSKTYGMTDEASEFFKRLSEQEEQELKELAEETLANCGLEKGIHSVDLVEFLETRLTKLEVRGFLRGKAIESLLEEDYQTASMCIKYFMDNGYIEVGEV